MAESDKSFFEDNVELYDGLVDWSKRLTREGPFYRRLFEENGIGRVLDVACGTGHHADMFHSWGLVVEGSDISPVMIAYCREHFGESDTLGWAVCSFDEAHPRPGSFDAAVCVGNSLELAGDYETVQKTMAALLGAVRSGGLCVIHVLNLWRIPEGPVVWQKIKRMDLGGNNYMVLKGVHRVGKGGYVEFVALDLSGASVVFRTKSATLLGLEADDLAAWAKQAGAGDVRFYGNYAGESYDRLSSQDLIIVCRRF